MDLELKMLIGPSIKLGYELNEDFRSQSNLSPRSRHLIGFGLFSLPGAGGDNLPVDIVGELEAGQLLTVGLLTSGPAALSHRESSGHRRVQGLAVVFPGVNSAALIIDIYTLITIILFVFILIYGIVEDVGHSYSTLTT